MDILTIAAAKKSGGSGGDVTKQYVDEHLVLKVDKVEGKGLSTNDYTNADKTKVSNSPISSSASGTSFVLTDAADGYVQNIKIKGATDSTTAQSVGEGGSVTVQTSKKNLYIGSPSFDGYNRLSLYTVSNETYNGDPVIYKTAAWNGAYTPLYLTPGTYTLSTMIKLSSAGSVYIYVTDLNGTQENIYQTSVDVGTSWTRIFGTFTITKSVWVSARFETGTYSADKTIYLSEYQLELGSTATAYEPYHGASATLTTGLPLCSVGDIKDEANFAKGIVIKRTKIENGAIVALDTPVEMPMTASELAAYHSLRTFESLTNIICTDSPQMILDYLIDTDNGKAIGHLITTFSETILYQDDMGETDVRQGTTITLSQAFTNFDEIIIEWGFTQNNYYETFSNSWRASYWSQVKEYQENNPDKTVEINMNYYNQCGYICFTPTADDRIYITTVAMVGGISRYITKIIGRKYNAA